jgi:OmpA-OmpF porin, OOP family
MALFDALVDDMAGRFGLGSNATPLVREGLALITGAPGGVGGFLNMFKNAGLSSLANAWLGQANPAPLAAQQIEQILGGTALSGVASRLGIGQAAVSTALAYAIPRLVGLLTPKGVVPTALPAEVTNFLAPVSGQVAPSHISVHHAAPEAAQVAPKRVDVYPAPAAAPEKDAGLPGWLWPALAALAVLLLGWWLWPRPAETPVAQAPAVAPAPTPPPVAQAPAPAPVVA